MKRVRIAGLVATSFGLLLLWAAPSFAQDARPGEKAQTGRGEPTAPFVDRDGDGIHDQMEHRFRRHKRAHGKRHGEGKGREERQQQQGKSSN